MNDKILELWNRLGYHDDHITGACHSYTIRWIEACLLGQSPQFDERKKLISELDIESFVIAIQRIKEKTKLHELLFLEEHHLINLLAFLESMFAFQSGLIQKDLLGFSRLRDINKISAIASTEEIYQKGGLVTCALEAGNYSKIDLEAWLERYEAAIKNINTPQNAFAFALASEGHVIGIMYQKNTGNWKVEDVQNIKMSNLPNISKQEVSEQIYIGLKIRAADEQAYLNWTKYFRKNLKVIEEKLANEKSKNQPITWAQDSFEITVIYDLETRKWSPKDKNHWLELEVMADYLALGFMGFTEPCPYINMATTMYLTQYDENSHCITQQFQLRLLPYEPSADWLKRANALHLAIVAVQAGNIDLVKKIMKMHLYDDASLSDALFLAAHENEIEIVNVLMTLPNLICLINQLSRSDSTPLIIAIQNGHVEMAKLLLSLGANPNISNSVGDSPLRMAAQEDYLEIVNCLIKANATLDKVNPNGATALSLAVEGNHIAVVESLVQAGANVSIPNHRGITPLQKAVALNYSFIVTLLNIEISRNHTGLKKSIISDDFSHGFFGLKNRSGDPTELGISRHFRGYSYNTPN